MSFKYYYSYHATFVFFTIATYSASIACQSPETPENDDYRNDKGRFLASKSSEMQYSLGTTLMSDNIFRQQVEKVKEDGSMVSDYDDPFFDRSTVQSQNSHSKTDDESLVLVNGPSLSTTDPHVELDTYSSNNKHSPIKSLLRFRSAVPTNIYLEINKPSHVSSHQQLVTHSSMTELKSRITSLPLPNINSRLSTLESKNQEMQGTVSNGQSEYASLSQSYSTSIQQNQQNENGNSVTYSSFNNVESKESNSFRTTMAPSRPNTKDQTTNTDQSSSNASTKYQEHVTKDETASMEQLFPTTKVQKPIESDKSMLLLSSVEEDKLHTISSIENDTTFDESTATDRDVNAGISAQKSSIVAHETESKGYNYERTEEVSPATTDVQPSSTIDYKPYSTQQSALQNAIQEITTVKFDGNQWLDRVTDNYSTKESENEDNISQPPEANEGISTTKGSLRQTKESISQELGANEGVSTTKGSLRQTEEQQSNASVKYDERLEIVAMSEDYVSGRYTTESLQELIGLRDNTMTSDADTSTVTATQSVPFTYASDQVTTYELEYSRSTQKTIISRSPQRVEYTEGDTGTIYWHCPPARDIGEIQSNLDYMWYKLSNIPNTIYNVMHPVDQLTNVLEIKNPGPFDEGRYVCISTNTSVFVAAKTFFYQFLILKTKWIDIGQSDTVAVFFNQRLILNCPHGDIIANQTNNPFQCASRFTVIDRYPDTDQREYRCTDSPRKTIKLSATNSFGNCSLSLLGCRSSEENHSLIISDRCVRNVTDFLYPWKVKRCPGSIFIRFYFDKVKQRCFPFESDICSTDFYSFPSMTQCENNCILINTDIQSCFYPQNVDNDDMCSDSQNGKYLVSYNIVSNDCVWFFRRDGCNISKNVFGTMKACRQTCVRQKQFIKTDMRKACLYNSTNTMVSITNVVRWVYVSKIYDCMERNVSLIGAPFTMSFTSKNGCQICKDDNIVDICRTKPENGQCKKDKISWHFDYLSRRCIRIRDGGCGESINRFISKAVCESVCAKYVMDTVAIPSNQYVTTTIANGFVLDTTVNMTSLSKLKKRPLRHLPTIDPLNIYSTTTGSQRFTVIPKVFDVSKRILDWDPCYGNSLIGTCDFGFNNQSYDLIRYKYVPEYNQCHRVSYSGCLADENLFDDSNECKTACEVRLYRSIKSKRCQHPYIHYCLDQMNSLTIPRLVRYYYSFLEKKCIQFYVVDSPKCLQQFFSTADECQNVCVPAPPSETLLQNKCFGRPVIDNSSCQASDRIKLWFYMRTIEQCLQYSTCPVQLKGNVFATRGKCEDSCLANNIFTVCSLPVDTGMGTRVRLRFYFDIHKRKCRMFPFKGSMGNLNRFRSWDECFQTCVKSMLDMDFEPQPQIAIDQNPIVNREYQGTFTNITALQIDTDREYCYDAHKSGVCNHIKPDIYVTKYYYNGYRRQCEPYLFSGCGAISRNSFDYMTVCNKMCTERIQRPSMSQLCLQKTHQCLNSSWIYWRYNSERGVCELFPSCTNSLPSGDALFNSEQNCSLTCVPPLPLKKDLFDICHLSSSVVANTECQSPSTRWFYDHDSSTCISGLSCESYGNNFPSLVTCMQWCMPRDPQDVCKLPRDKGPCTDDTSVYFYFDWKDQHCKNFTYGGCLGNRNRFSTLKDCMTVCSVRRRCNIKIKTNDCRVHVRHDPPIFMYHSRTNQCIKINETVCGNFFEFYPTKERCENECVVTEEALSIVFGVPNKTQSSQLCQESLKFNNYPICSKTQHWFPRYYYDEYKRDCSFFYYNGCDGTADRGNRFSSMIGCRETCLGSHSTTLFTSSTAHTTTTNIIQSTQLIAKFGVCPKSHNKCLALVSIMKTCRADTDCDTNSKCCGCDFKGSLSYQCMEPVGCMLSSYGCCANSDDAADDKVHSSCPKVSPKIIPANEIQIFKISRNEFHLECLVTGDPMPTINWVHLDSNSSFSVESQWDLTRPVWSGILKLNNSDRLNDDMWVCRCTNEVGRDDSEVMISSGAVTLTSSLRLYEETDLNGTTKYVALGTNVVVHCPIYGVPRPSIKWLFNNSLVADTKSIHRRFLYLNNIDQNHEGWWMCVAQQNQSWLTFTIRIRVLEPVRILPPPQGRTIKATIGGTVNLYCNVIGKPSPDITWTRIRNALYSNIASTSMSNDKRILVIPSYSAESEGDYVCRAKNIISEDSVTFTVTSIDETEIIVVPSGFHFTGDSITLRCPFKPSEKIHQVSWKKDHVYVETKALEIKFVLHSKLDSGFYTCHHGGRTYHTYIYVNTKPI